MYDAIVVGARCAGSPTAMLLARKGYRVLLLDKAGFPSDTLSTHYIHQPGVACLKRWGLLDRVVASNCPPIRQNSLDVGPFALVGAPTPADGVADAYAPRRTVLDQILVDAAVAAGAELREHFSVDGARHRWRPRHRYPRPRRRWRDGDRAGQHRHRRRRRALAGRAQRPGPQLQRATDPDLRLLHLLERCPARAAPSCIRARSG